MPTGKARSVAPGASAIRSSLRRLATRSYRSRLLAAIALLLPLAACNRDVEERLGIDEKRGSPQFDVDRLEKSGELERAVATSASEVARRLGSYRLRQKAIYTMAAVNPQVPGDVRKDVLDETWLLEIDAKGNHHLLRENSHDQGIESWAVGGRVYVKPRHGQTVHRTAEGDEIERARDEVQSVVAGALAVVGRFAEREDEGDVDVAGRRARRIVLTLDDSPPRLKDQDPVHAWRRTMKASALSGEVAVDVESGAPLRAVLDTTYVARRNPTVPVGGGEDGRATAPAPRPEDEITVNLHLEAGIEAVGAVPAIAAPEGAAPAPLRPRPLLEKQQLLEGLVSAPVKPRHEKQDK